MAAVGGSSGDVAQLGSSIGWGRWGVVPSRSAIATPRPSIAYGSLGLDATAIRQALTWREGGRKRTQQGYTRYTRCRDMNGIGESMGRVQV
eukprot:1138575-Prorocentrum_minimum.AAC.1